LTVAASCLASGGSEKLQPARIQAMCLKMHGASTSAALRQCDCIRVTPRSHAVLDFAQTRGKFWCAEFAEIGIPGSRVSRAFLWEAGISLLNKLRTFSGRACRYPMLLCESVASFHAALTISSFLPLMCPRKLQATEQMTVPKKGHPKRGIRPKTHLRVICFLFGSLFSDPTFGGTE
jgi:hypothetical protein